MTNPKEKSETLRRFRLPIFVLGVGVLCLQSLVRCWVIDNGIGISDEHLERIFRVFERLHGPEKYSGTGIGLAIVKKGVERMNRRVGVESKWKEGSRFWIELPAVN